FHAAQWHGFIAGDRADASWNSRGHHGDRQGRCNERRNPGGTNSRSEQCHRSREAQGNEGQADKERRRKVAKVAAVEETVTASFNAIAVIPARLGSTRLSRKVLREIAGKPMVGHVYESAKKCSLLREVIIATDSDEVMQLAKACGWNAQMTSAQHRSGTDRMYEVAQRVPADVYVNIQGDLPMVKPEHIDALLNPMRKPEVVVS